MGQRLRIEFRTAIAYSAAEEIGSVEEVKNSPGRRMVDQLRHTTVEIDTNNCVEAKQDQRQTVHSGRACQCLQMPMKAFPIAISLWVVVSRTNPLRTEQTA